MKLNYAIWMFLESRAEKLLYNRFLFISDFWLSYKIEKLVTLWKDYDLETEEGKSIPEWAMKLVSCYSRQIAHV